MGALLTEIVETATKMGLNLQEIDLLRAEFNFAFYHHLETSECKGTDLRSSLQDISNAEHRGYTIGLRYIQKTVDEWHTQADGNK